MRFLRAVLILLLVISAMPAFCAPVLMISIDGMRPDYVTKADAHGLRIPNLRRFLVEGTYADGVVGVCPTVTYPSHTTLVTGVWPAEHGVYNNSPFDPERKLAGDWYWYAEAVNVPTLWSVSHDAGIKTASISWPVSVNARGVDVLIPEYWRAHAIPGVSDPSDIYLMNAVSRPDNALDAMGRRLGPYNGNSAAPADGDETRTKYSLDILQREKPGFMTIHLSSLDAAEHASGPFSQNANSALERIDGMVGRLASAEFANDPAAMVLVVSDHGFASVEHAVNFYIPFIESGLIQMGKGPHDQTVISWQAEPWMAGGMAAIMLHDANDKQVEQRVHDLLTKLAADSNNGIAAVLDRDAVKKLGGFPNATFLVALKPGFIAGSELSGPLISSSPVKGMHGYLPSFPEMRSAFFAMGQGVARGRDLGVVDMRQIAPTIAGVLDVKLTTAKESPLHIHP